MTIEIKDIKTKALIGIYPSERKCVQPVIISVKLSIKTKSHLTDEIKDTLDYDVLEKNIRFFVEHSSFFLLERLAYCIMELLFKDNCVERAALFLRKPNALGNRADIVISCEAEKAVAKEGKEEDKAGFVII